MVGPNSMCGCGFVSKQQVLMVLDYFQTSLRVEMVRRGGQHAHNCLLVLPLDIEHSCMPTNLMLDFRNLKLVSKLFMNS
jgi:hypothetical protein